MISLEHFWRDGEWYVYNAIEGMEAFEPWLQILENDLNEDVLTSLAGLIPPIWYDFDVVALKTLLTSLNERRKLVREMLHHGCNMNRHSFRNWTTSVNDHSFAADLYIQANQNFHSEFPAKGCCVQVQSRSSH